jgi:hypothetical protein
MCKFRSALLGLVGWIGRGGDEEISKFFRSFLVNYSQVRIC